MVPPDSRRITRVLRYSGTHYARAPFDYRAVTVSGLPFQAVCLESTNAISRALQPPEYLYFGFGLIPVRSPLLGESLSCFLFLRVLRCFTSPRLLHTAYVFSRGYPIVKSGGFPHSEILGSKPVSGSPRLIAAVHVLHRLPSPRHPPCALIILIVSPRRYHECHPTLLSKSEFDAHIFNCQRSMEALVREHSRSLKT